MPRRAHTTALLAVLTVALLHALFQARVRPLYQVSDEMAYLRAAQIEVLPSAHPSLRACIAPPEGTVLLLGEGGKRGFRAVAGLQLQWLCRYGGADLPLFLMRSVQAVSFPAIALAAWYLAWLLSGSRLAAFTSALLVAVHPVAAKYAGGVTPDAWANAFSAGAFVAGARILLGRHAWWDWALLALWTFAGLLWKDTTTVLVVHALLVMGLCGLRAISGLRRGHAPARLTQVAAALVIASSMLVAFAWPSALRTPYLALVPDAYDVVASRPRAMVGAVLHDATVNGPGLLASSFLSLYRPLVYGHGQWSAQPVTPAWPVLALVLSIGLGFLGVLIVTVRPVPSMRPLDASVLTIWITVAAACALQPSVRQILLDLQDLHQGRWLFPLLAPAAALAGVGLRGLFGAPALPLFTLAHLSGLWMVVLDLVGHFYIAFPERLQSAALFTRPTGDHDVGDALVGRLIEQTMTAQTPVLTWGILVLLAVASVWLSMSVARLVSPASTHV